MQPPPFVVVVTAGLFTSTALLAWMLAPLALIVVAVGLVAVAIDWNTRRREVAARPEEDRS